MKTLLEALKDRKLKDPAKPARAMRVTLPMVQAEGAGHKYPSFARDVKNSDGSIDCDVPYTTAEYVAEYVKANHLTRDAS